MTDRSKTQEKLKRLRQATAKKTRPASSTTRQRAGGGLKRREQARPTMPAAHGREGLRQRLANRASGGDVGNLQPADRGARRSPTRGQQRQREGVNAAGSRGRLAKLLAERRGKGAGGGAVRQSRTDADTKLSEAQRHRLQEYIRQRREGGDATPRTQGRGRPRVGVESEAPLKDRYLGQYDEREGEAPQARVKRKLMRTELMKEFADRKREAEKAREEQTRQLTSEASKNMGMLFDESKKPTVGSTAEEIEQYHAQLSIRADWLRATLDEIQAELKMLEQIKAAADERDIDAMIDGEQQHTQEGGPDGVKP